MAVILAAASPVFAGGLSVSPVVVDTTIKKSGDVLPPIKVSNDSDQPLDVTVEFQPLGHDVSGAPKPVGESFKFSGAKIMSVKQPHFSLKPGQSTNLEVKVDAPANRAGGAYAIMYVLGKPANAAQAKSVATYLRIGVIIELGMPGEPKKAFTAGKVDAMQDAANGPIAVLVRANNTGETHLAIGGTASITDAKGKEIGKINLDPANVFPTLSRNIKGTWKPPAGTAAGKYNVVATLNVPNLPAVTAKGTVELVKPGELAQNKATVQKFATPPVVQKKPINLEATVANQGNVPFSPVGHVEFLNDKNEVVQEASMAAASPIPAGQKASIKGVYDKGLAPGTYQARLEILNANDNSLTTFASSLQVLDKEVKIAGKIAKLTTPNDKEPFVGLEFKNDGNTDLDVSGIVLVYDQSKNTVGQIPLEKQTVKPGGSAKYNRPAPDGLSDGLYDMEANLTYGSGNSTQTASQTAKYFKKAVGDKK